jgi:hypothetical protein
MERGARCEVSGEKIIYSKELFAPPLHPVERGSGGEVIFQERNMG